MKSIIEKIKVKGLTKQHVAKMIGTDAATLSRIMKGKQEYVSEHLINRIHFYLDKVNSDDKNILQNMSNNFDSK